jgi:hypothetical protein
VKGRLDEIVSQKSRTACDHHPPAGHHGEFIRALLYDIIQIFLKNVFGGIHALGDIMGCLLTIVTISIPVTFQ